MEKYCVNVGTLWQTPWPKYFENFYNHCQEKAETYKCKAIVVANSELKQLGGKLIQTKTQGWYLRWDNKESHTIFVLKWI